MSYIGTKPADQILDSTLIADGTILTADLANGAVTSAKIADANVTPAKLSQPLTSGTAVAISGNPLTVTFTGIPSWAKRVTIMFNSVSSNGTSNYNIQIGSGSMTTSGYTGGLSRSTVVAANSAGFQVVSNNAASNIYSGIVTLTLLGNNTWAQSGNITSNASDACTVSGGSVTLSGAMDQLRLIAVNVTDLFDAGSINILYE